MNPAKTRVSRLQEQSERLRTFRTAVSLHSHTHSSRENLSFLPYYAKRIPVIGRLVESRLTDYEQRHGKPLDFKQAYWTPPASPAMVLTSETAQIEKSLGLAALVSITDHDSITSGLSLQHSATPSVPISVEWTVPFAGNLFHIGVHCLLPASAVEVTEELARYTAEPREEMLGDLFTMLERSPETLLVFNHPCSDFVKVGKARQDASLKAFMARWRRWMHALELNGMRPWHENQAVIEMAEACQLPVVAGGDRHGLRPNTVLNLSRAGTWGEFVAEIRESRRSEILVMPEYEEPVRLRELATAGEALRHYSDHPDGRCRFVDRVFADVFNCGTKPLSFYWDEDDARQPPWLNPVASVVVFLGSDPVRPVLRRLLSLRSECHDVTWPPLTEHQDEALTATTGLTQ